jgi:hypothetical protein
MAFISATQTLKYQFYTDLPAAAQDGDLAWCQDTNLSYRYSSNASTWAPLTRELVKTSTVTIDGKTTGATTIYTLEGSGTLNFYPTQIVIRQVSVTGTVILKPTFSVGSNSTAYDNIASGSLLNTVTSLAGITQQPMNVGSSPALAGGTVIKANVTVGATTTGNYQFRIDVLGYYGT